MCVCFVLFVCLFVRSCFLHIFCYYTHTFRKKHVFDIGLKGTNSCIARRRIYKNGALLLISFPPRQGSNSVQKTFNDRERSGSPLKTTPTEEHSVRQIVMHTPKIICKKIHL